jgi:hypothetical protein
MPKIIPFACGAGLHSLLLRRILYDQQEWQWQVGKPYQVHNLGTLKKYLPYYLQRASNETDCAAILIELDLDNGHRLRPSRVRNMVLGQLTHNPLQSAY